MIKGWLGAIELMGLLILWIFGSYESYRPYNPIP